MCCCEKPNVNGEPGYSWNGKGVSTREPSPPALHDGDRLLYDEPGRCGGLDSHCHHFVLVRDTRGNLVIRVRNGCGDSAVVIARNYSPGSAVIEKQMAAMDSNGRYLFMQAIVTTHSNAITDARDEATNSWSLAAIEKRIKIRRRGGHKYVSITPRVVVAESSAAA